MSKQKAPAWIEPVLEALAQYDLTEILDDEKALRERVEQILEEHGIENVKLTKIEIATKH